MKKHYLNRGRPPLDQSVKRHKAMCLRLREDELKELKARAAEAGVSVAHYIREKALGGKSNG